MAEVHRKLVREGSFQSLLDIIDKVLGLLNTNRQPDEIVADAKKLPLSGRNASVSHLGRELSKTLYATERLGQGKQLGRSQELVGLLSTTPDPKRDHSAVWEAGVFWSRVVLPIALNEFECILGEGTVCQTGLRVGRETRVDDFVDPW